MNARRRLGLASIALVTAAALLAPLSPNTASAEGRGFDPANLDTTCKPCDDFYAYANGGWMKSNPVPGEQASWGMFDKLYDRNQTQLKQILEEAAANASSPAGSLERKLGDFFASGMDMARIDANGLTPLGADLARRYELLAAELRELIRKSDWNNRAEARGSEKVAVRSAENERNRPFLGGTGEWKVRRLARSCWAIWPGMTASSTPTAAAPGGGASAPAPTKPR